MVSGSKHGGMATRDPHISQSDVIAPDTQHQPLRDENRLFQMDQSIGSQDLGL